LLLMSSLVAEIFTVGSKTVVAVAMISSSLGEHLRKGTPVGEGKQEWEATEVEEVNAVEEVEDEDARSRRPWQASSKARSRMERVTLILKMCGKQRTYRRDFWMCGKQRS